MKALFVVIVITAAALTGCSGAKIMKDCKHLGQNFYECYKP
jgi:hypothetical protein